jgi:hypothetical protein
MQLIHGGDDAINLRQALGSLYLGYCFLCFNGWRRLFPAAGMQKGLCEGGSSMS